MDLPASSLVASRRTATQQATLALAGSAIAFAILQVALGASPVLVLALLATTIVTLVPVRVYGLSHIVGLLFFVMCFYFGYNGLAVPSLFLRKADTELFVPELSGAVVFAFAASAAAAALAVRALFPNLPLLVRPIVEPHALRRMAVVAFGIGLFGSLLSARGLAVSIAAFCAPYLYFALALELSATLKESGGRRSLSMLGVAMIAIIVIATTAGNSKAGLIIAAGIWVIANLAFGRRFAWRAVVPLLLLGVLFTYMFLAINVVRAFREEVASADLVTMTVETAVGLATGDPEAIAQVERMQTANVSRNLLFYSVLYFEGLPVLTERFIMLPYADAILRSVPADGPFAGTSFVTGQMADLLPIFLKPDKTSTYAGNVIVTNLGLGDQNFNGNPTIGLAAELFYANGFPLVIAASAVLFFALTAVLSVAVGPITGSALGIYVAARYVHFLNVGTTTGIVFFMGRQLPVDVAFVVLMAWLAGGTPRAASPRLAT